MPTRTAEAEWKGNLLEGAGTIKLGSGAFEGSYDWRGRSADGAGTNPEELIGAAHAGCFSMALPLIAYTQPQKFILRNWRAVLPSPKSS
jgi:osmotically inducible protein OsmC